MSFKPGITYNGLALFLAIFAISISPTALAGHKRGFKAFPKRDKPPIETGQDREKPASFELETRGSTVPTPPAATAAGDTDSISAPTRSNAIRGRLTFAKCIDFALKNSGKRNVSHAGTMVAEAQHRQSLAAYWPQINMTVSAQLRSNEPNFAFPGLSIETDAMNFKTDPMSFTTKPGQITTPPTTITIPTGNPQQPYAQIPVPAQRINVPSQSVDVPALEVEVPSQRIEVEGQKFDLMDRFSYGAGIDAKWLLADGGERRARRRQGLAGIRAAQQGEREAMIEIISDVKRYYYGAVLSANLIAIGEDVLTRMETTLEMTESFYKGGSMKVTKLDYLSNKVMVDALRATLITMRANYELACSALTHSMGLGWESRIEPTERTLVHRPTNVGLPQLVEQGYRFSPDWKRLLAGLDAAENGVKKARSGYLPKLAFTGKIHAIENGFDGGFATDENLNAWTVGIGLELPLFRGFLTKNQVGEAKARLKQLEGQQVLLKEGLAMLVKKHFIDLKAAQDREAALGDTATSAKENRDLTDRAYRAGMAEADKIFEALMFDALARASQLRTRYAAIEARIHLDSIVGGSFAALVDSEFGNVSPRTHHPR